MDGIGADVGLWGSWAFVRSRTQSPLVVHVPLPWKLWDSS